MSNRSAWRSVVLTAVLTLVLPLAVSAQTDDDNEPLPVIEGLGWYTSIDVAGAEVESAFSEDQVEQWVATLDVAGASIEDLEYTYRRVVDPEALPQLGGLATVRIEGAAEEEVLAAILADIAAQAESIGAVAPPSESVALGGKDVTRIELPEELGPDDAFVYVRGDTAWVFIMQEELAELGLQVMP